MPQHRTVIGLDIGAHSAKLVRADRHGKGFEITRAEVMRLPPGARDMADIIRRWLGDLGMLKFPFVVSLSGRNVMFQAIAVASEDPRSFEQIAALEIAKINELAAETTVYDFLPVQPPSGHRKVLIGMARPAVLDEVLALRQALKVEVIDIVPAAAALMVASRTFGLFDAPAGSRGGVHVCADIGDGGTELAIGGHGGLLFARSFAVGGDLFTQAVMRASEAARPEASKPALQLRSDDALRPAASVQARGTNLTAAQAESLKESQPLLLKGDEAQRSSLARAADMWISELRASLSAFHSVFPEEPPQPARLVLSGGGAEMAGLTEHIAGHLGIPVIRATDLPACPDRLASGRLAVAAGLAIQGMLAGAGSLSLLPAAMRDEIVLRRQKRYWIAAGITAALILTTSVLGGYRDFRHMTARLGAQKESLRRCQELAAQIDQAKARNAHIVAMAEPVRTMLSNGGIIGRLLDVVSEARGPNDWITMISDADSYFAGAAVFKRGLPIPPAPVRITDPSGQPPPPPPGTYSAFGRVMIEIYTQRQDPATVKTLIWALRSKPFVVSADLLADDQLVQDPERDERWGKPASRRFVIDVRTKQP